MKVASIFFLAFGGLGLVIACVGAPSAPDLAHLVGSFLPGLTCLIIGLKLQQAKNTESSSSVDSEAGAADSGPASCSDLGDKARAEAFKFRANLGIGCGILLMFLGGATAQATDDSLLVALPLSFTGWACAIWGCVNYTRWKGYSGWFGLFSYLLLPGLLILVCFPNRRRRLLEEHQPEQIMTWKAMLVEDQSPGYRFLLILVPLGALFVSLGGFLIWSRSNVDAAEWKEVAPPGIGFRALMPGTPKLTKQVQETPVGRVEVHKFAVESRNKKELFMIISSRFLPEDVSREMGKVEELLNSGRQDLLWASKGQLKSEKQFVSKGCPGLELEILPPKGAIIRARIFATRNQIYQVFVGVPRIRSNSDDVQKFLDSFELSAKPEVVAGQSSK